MPAVSGKEHRSIISRSSRSRGKSHNNVPLYGPSILALVVLDRPAWVTLSMAASLGEGGGW